MVDLIAAVALLALWVDVARAIVIETEGPVAGHVKFPTDGRHFIFLAEGRNVDDQLPGQNFLKFAGLLQNNAPRPVAIGRFSSHRVVSVTYQVCHCLQVAESCSIHQPPLKAH